MGMIITTSDGTLDTQGLPNWVCDPTAPDAEPLYWSAGFGSVCDTLRAIGVEPGADGYSDNAWPLTEVEPMLATAQAALAPDDDYLGPRLAQVASLIAAGKERGAIWLTAS